MNWSLGRCYIHIININLLICEIKLSSFGAGWKIVDSFGLYMLHDILVGMVRCMFFGVGSREEHFRKGCRPNWRGWGGGSFLGQAFERVTSLRY